MILLNQTIKKKLVESNGWNSGLWDRDNKNDDTSKENMAQSSGWSAWGTEKKNMVTSP